MGWERSGCDERIEQRNGVDDVSSVYGFMVRDYLKDILVGSWNEGMGGIETTM